MALLLQEAFYLGEAVGRRVEVQLVQGHELRSLSQLRVVKGQLSVQHDEVFARVSFAGCVEQMDQQPRALDVTQESVPSSNSPVSALD